MKRYSFIIWMIFLTGLLGAQNVSPIQLIQEEEWKEKNLIPKANSILMSIDRKELLEKLNRNEAWLEIPFPNGSIKQSKWSITNILSPNYKLYTSSGEIFDTGNQHLFFQGILLDDPNSRACMYIGPKSIHITITSENGHYEINPHAKGIWAGYYSENILTKNMENWDCKVLETESPKGNSSEKKSFDNTDCVDVFYEIDKRMYEKKGNSIPLTESWALNILSQTAILFAEHDIPLKVSGIQIWDTPDPYLAATNTSQALSIFRNLVKDNPNNNGRLAHLLSGRSLGGGIAYLNSLCSTSTNVAVSANLNGGTVSYPNYSWNVMVITHELGHNFGSPHTHSCSWNGNNTAIDGCGSANACGQTPPIPSQGGTIMSYCHLKSVGINFNEGFGDQPGALIKQRWQDSYCDTGGDCDYNAFHNFCERARKLHVSNHCMSTRYQIEGANSSGFGLNATCGNNVNKNDLWFYLEHPGTNTLTLEATVVHEDFDEFVIEVYKGNCDNMIYDTCTTVNMTNSFLIDYNAYMPEDSILYFRIIDNAEIGFGEFELCAYSNEIECSVQADSLLVLYENNGGSNWLDRTGWEEAYQNGYCNYCQWKGVQCDEIGNVIALDLSSNQLSGSFPKLHGLYFLRSIELQHNNLTDTLINHWNGFPRLKIFNASYNAISGKIPESFQSSSYLKELYLDHNMITGRLPLYLGSNRNLRKMTLNDNELEGCFTYGINSFCSKDSIQLENNPQLVNEGDISILCNDGMGLDNDGDLHCAGFDDCNDNDNQINYSLDEILCDNKDNNCNGQVDEGSNFGPNIWIGPSSGGDWLNGDHWSLGHSPYPCESIEIGMNGDSVALEMLSRFDTLFGFVKYSQMSLGQGVEITIPQQHYVEVICKEKLLNKGIINVLGGMNLGMWDISNDTLLLNDGLIVIENNGNISMNNASKLALLNSEDASINNYGYLDFSFNIENSEGEIAIKNDGAINNFNNISFYGSFVKGHIVNTSQGQMSLKPLSNIYVY